MHKLVPVLALLSALTACSQSPAPADSSVITSRSEAWEAALNGADTDALVDIYTSDARLLPPNGPMTSGSDAVRAIFGGMIDAGIGGDLTSVEATVVGDIGYNVGNYTLTAGDTVVDSGKYIETWSRGADGQWRIANDIWNSDMPAMAPADDAPSSHVMILHQVEDADRWFAAWRGEDSRHKLFKDNGAAHVHTFRNEADPNLTGLVIAVNDMAAMEAMLSSEEGQAAATEDGVKMDTMTVLIEAE
jgi:ketosteroid isomerase-like protein